jgi:hypothetical protein
MMMRYKKILPIVWFVVFACTGVRAEEASALSQASEQILTGATDPTMPVVSFGGSSKAQAFKSFFASLAIATPKELVGRGVDAFKRLVLDEGTTSLDLTIDNLDEIKLVADGAVAVLTRIGFVDKNRLDPVAKSIGMITARAVAQRALLATLDDARKLATDVFGRVSDGAFNEKIQRYDTVLGGLASDVLASSKQILINDLRNLLTAAQRRDAKQFDKTKNVLVKAMSVPGFTDAERKQLSDIMASLTPPIAGTMGLVGASISSSVLAPASSISTFPSSSVALKMPSVIATAGSVPPVLTGQAAVPASKTPVVLPVRVSTVASPVSAVTSDSVNQSSSSGSTATAAEIAAINKALASASEASLPLAAGVSERSKIQEAKALFAQLNSRVPKDLIDKCAVAYQQLVLDPAQQLATLTIDNLEEIKTVTGLATSALKLSGDIKASRFDDAVTKITARLAKQRAFLRELDRVRKMPDSAFKNKIKQYELIVGAIAPDVLESCKKILISDMKNLFFTAQKREEAELEAVKKLIIKAQTVAGFADAERQLFADIIASKVAISATPINTAAPATTTVTGSVNAVVAAKLKELDGSMALKKRCTIVRELIGMISPSSSVSEKNQIITQANQLFMMQYMMNSIDIADVVATFKNIATHASLLSPEQRIVLDDWLKTLALVQTYAVPNQSLLVVIKKGLGNIKIDLKRTVKMLPIAIMLLSTKLPKEELDKTFATGLVAILNKNMPILYSLRSIKDLQLLSDMKNVLMVALQNTLLKDSIKPLWLENMVLLSKLGGIAQEPIILKRLQAYRLLIKDFKPTTESFEKGIFVSALATLYANRYERAQIEIEEFGRLIDDCLAPATVGFFSVKEQGMFADWKKSLVMLIRLLIVQQQTDIKTQCGMLREILPSLSDRMAGKERTTLISILNKMFLHRGNFTAADLSELVTFLKEVKKPQQVVATQSDTKEQKLLSAGQQEVVDQWLADLTEAQAITATGSFYLDSLLKAARDKGDVMLYSKSLDAFTGPLEATLTRVNLYIEGLNSLIQSRSISNRSNLKALLARFMQKKIGQAYLLTDEQRRVVGLWEKSL